MSLAYVLVSLTNEAAETVATAASNGNNELATTAAIAALATAAVATQTKKVSKLKMLALGAKAKWKSIFAKKKVEPLLLTMAGTMIGLAGFVILLGALFGSGAVGIIVLGSLILLAGAVIAYLGVTADE